MPAPQLVIVRLAKAGTMVRKGELLVEFDRTSQLKNARDREAEYRDILAQIDKKQAEQIIARAARQTGLKIAENAVRRAELDLVGVEMLAKITAEKNQQVLEEARAKLAQLRKTNELHERAAAAVPRLRRGVVPIIRAADQQTEEAKTMMDEALTPETHELAESGVPIARGRSRRARARRRVRHAGSCADS